MRAVQVEGITLEIMEQALGQAREGRRHILAAMQACSPPPRRQLSSYAPRIGRLQVFAVCHNAACHLVSS